MTRARHLATVALFTVLVIVHTWPLVLGPATRSRVDNADYSLNAWALAWVVHQAPRKPLHLFDANIFYPEPRTLAFSEHLVPQAVVAAPVLLAGGSAVLAYNLAMLAGFVLSAWAMTLVITRWTGDWTAGLIAGSLHAFNAHTLTRLVHIQALYTCFLPLALLALDAVLTRRRLRDALGLAAAGALQGLTSGYWLVFTLFALGAAALARVGEWRRRPVALIAVSALLGGLVLAPFLYPYWLAKQQQGLSRPIGEVIFFSANGIEYLTSAGRLHMLTPLKWAYLSNTSRDAMFPGVLGVVLAAVAMGSGLAWRDRRARMLLAIGVAGFFFSFGPATWPYRWIYRHVALLQGIRAPSRFGALVLVAVAGLGGFAAARLNERLAARGTSRASRVALLLLLLAIVNAEALRAPLWYQRYEGVSPVYKVVARLPGDVVLAEFPMYQPSAFYKNADYMLSSTVHWKPLVNGYSGYQPASYRRLAEAMRTFPDPPTTDVLRKAGVTHVIIHRNLFGAGRDLLLAAMDRSGEFVPVAGDEQVRLYRLLPR